MIKKIHQNSKYKRGQFRTTLQQCFCIRKFHYDELWRTLAIDSIRVRDGSLGEISQLIPG